MVEEIVLNCEQLACLASPACHQVAITLNGAGQASATELSKSIGKAPATVLYHLRKLEAVGLVEVADRRATNRRPEAIYAPAAASMRLPVPNENSDGLITKAILAGMRDAMRGYAASTGRHFKHVLRASIRLSPDDARAFLEMVEAANRFAIKQQLAEGGVQLQWSSVVYPVG